MMRLLFRFLVVALPLLAITGVVVASGPQDPPDSMNRSVEEIIRLLGTDSQAGYLADGDVTLQEREAAFAESVVCMEAQGLTVVVFAFDDRGGESFDVTAQIDDAALDAIVTACRDEYYEAVSAVYNELHGPTAADEAAEALVIAQCMRDAGIDVELGLSFEELLSVDPLQASRCWAALHPQVAP